MIGFDRLGYYTEYYRNLTPREFGVENDGDKIVISNIKNRKNINEMELPKFSMVQPIEVSDDDKQKLKGVSISEIDFEPLNSTSPINFKVSVAGFPDITNGIAFDAQETKNELLQPHISLHDELKGLGLGYKLYKRFIELYGHLYSSPSRRQNRVEVPKIWAKLKNEPDIECVSNGLGDLCTSKKYTSDKDKAELLAKMGIVDEGLKRIKSNLNESLNRFYSH